MVMFDKDFLDLRNEERRIIVNNHEIKILTPKEFRKSYESNGELERNHERNGTVFLCSLVCLMMSGGIFMIGVV